MKEIFEKVVNYLNSPAVTVVVAAVVVFVIIRFIYRKIFKKNSVRLVVSVITVCIVIFIVVLMILRYFEGINEVYLKDDMNYVYGKVVYVDSSKMEIRVNVVRSNLKKGGTGEVYGKLMATTKILYNNKAIEEKITLKDIKTGDYIYMVTNDEEVKNKEIEVRAVLKQVSTSIFSILMNERTTLTEKTE